jgi:ubiquinone/menaquinone biosynthesis C-methylase UbiE
LIAVEQQRGIVEPWAVLSKRLTTDDNRRMWNEYDWSQHGEEWTSDDAWKASIIREFMDPHVASGADIVEIGPGGGRWTEILQTRAHRLWLVDVAEKPLELCRARFSSCTNIEYLLSDGRSLPVGTGEVDAIWSFDVFVHINPLDIRQYFFEFARVLRTGGRAVIHHAGPHDPKNVYRSGVRSDMTDAMAREFASQAGLTVDLQTKELINPRDVVTVLRKPA